MTKRRSGTAGALLGLAIMVVSEVLTLRHVEPFWSWNTPIAWTGFILFADSIVWGARGSSWIRSAPREFAVLALASIPLWGVFEIYNLFIKNWYYTGLPENVVLRYFGYAWSFATIWPAIFEAAELVGVRRGTRIPSLRMKAAPPDMFSPGEIVSIAVGAFLVGCPIVSPPEIRPYLAAPVWLGFIFLLDPFNRHMGGESLAEDLRQGRTDRLINIGVSGVVCGLLWEFWNFWSRAKWHYTVPIMENLKLFEMPVPGYLGFPAFAYECFTMYEFARCVYFRMTARGGAPSGRPIGL